MDDAPCFGYADEGGLPTQPSLPVNRSVRQTLGAWVATRRPPMTRRKAAMSHEDAARVSTQPPLCATGRNESRSMRLKSTATKARKTLHAVPQTNLRTSAERTTAGKSTTVQLSADYITFEWGEAPSVLFTLPSLSAHISEFVSPSTSLQRSLRRTRQRSRQAGKTPVSNIFSGCKSACIVTMRFPGALAGAK